MDIKSQILISLTSYKIISLLVGAFFGYMGYKLFTKGIWGSSGNMEAEFGDNKIVLKKAAPGIFFALFGSIIIITTISKKLELEYEAMSPKENKIPKSEQTNKELINDMPNKPPI